MKKSPKAWRFTVKPEPTTRLPPGGWYSLYRHIGHLEVTDEAAKKLGFSASARDILRDAAQDPDFYDFGTVPAHAQTPDNADEPVSDIAEWKAIVDKAKVNYVKWVDDQFRKCTSALDKGNVRLALYWLGYALHGVEDLAVHRGITNGEHATTADNPDYQADGVDLSYKYAGRVLDEVRNALGQERFDLLRTYQGEGELSYLEKVAEDIHPEGLDVDNHLVDYWEAGARYKDLDPSPTPVRWDRESVLSKVLETILRR